MEPLVRQFLDIYQNQVRWPTKTHITQEARATYDQGLSTLDAYRGDPNILLRALKVFISTDCLPYAYAGAAVVLEAASFDSGDKYDEEGLQYALEYLQKAQDLAPDQFEINFLEARIYLSTHEDAKAGTILKYLADNMPSAYPDKLYLCRTMMHFWYNMQDRKMYENWYDLGMKVARTGTDRLHLLGMRAGFYGKLKDGQDVALECYQEIVKITPKDPWCWHNMSIIYYKKKQYRQASDCNQRALKIMDFEAARYVERKIKEEWKGRKGLFG